MAKRGIAMVSAASECLRYRREHKTNDEEKIIGNLMKFIKNTEFTEYKLEMIAAGSKAVHLFQRNPEMSDREIIFKIVNEIDKEN